MSTPNPTQKPHPNNNRTNPKATSSSLAPLLRHFIGIPLIVETKHGKSFQGRLVEADAYMNLVLNKQDDKINHSDNEDVLSSFDWFHIRGPSIRYVVFGSNVDIVKTIREGRDRERSATDRYRRGVRKAKS